MDAGPSSRRVDAAIRTMATYGKPCALARGPLSFALWFPCLPLHLHVGGARNHAVLRR